MYKLVHKKLAHSIIIKPFILHLYFLIPFFLRKNSTEKKIIRSYINNKKDFSQSIFFINIGSNDGLSGDPLYEFIRKYKLGGICVEPVHFVFQRLKENYKKFKKVKLLNVAVGTKKGSKKFYFLKKNTILQSGYDQIGSFDKRHLIKHNNMFVGLKNFIVSKKIKIIKFNQLFSNRNYIDILLIDTEGYDYEILNSINFDQYEFGLIIFETIHLGGDKCIKLKKKLSASYFFLENVSNNILINRKLNLKCFLNEL